MEIKRIMAPIDFSARSREELRWAITLATNFGADLISLHVVPPEAFEAAIRTGRDWEAMRAEILTEENLLVEEICRDLSIAGLVHNGHVVTGNPVEEILDAVKRERADLVVISTHGRTGLPHALLGSVAEKVVRQSPVPVLTLSHAAMTVAA